MNIALSELLEEPIRRRAEAAGFKTADEYVEAIVLADLDRAGAATAPKIYPKLSPETEARIREGLDQLDAGLGVKVDEAFWEEIHRRVREPKAGA
jgi:hypothetical protein